MKTKTLLKLISYLGLAMSILPAMLFFAGKLDRQTYLNLLIVGMILWFSTAIFWIKSDHRA